MAASVLMSTAGTLDVVVVVAEELAADSVCMGSEEPLPAVAVEEDMLESFWIFLLLSSGIAKGFKYL